MDNSLFYIQTCHTMFMRKYKNILLGLFLLGILSYFFWPEEPPRYPTNGSTVVVFGDSLAEGVGATAGYDIASRLASALPYEVVNLGVSGDTTADGLNRIDSLLAADPRVVVLLLGGNDAIRKLPVKDTFANLSSIIEQIQASGAAVILVGEPGGLYGSQYENEYERLAKEYRTFYVSNILSGLIGKTGYMSDYIHPNDAGYEKAAARIIPVVKEAMSEK
jgi:acyl-CoA thioesterase-1